jgi:hypothetical protein
MWYHDDDTGQEYYAEIDEKGQFVERHLCMSKGQGQPLQQQQQPQQSQQAQSRPQSQQPQQQIALNLQQQHILEYLRRAADNSDSILEKLRSIEKLVNHLVAPQTETESKFEHKPERESEKEGVK